MNDAAPLPNRRVAFALGVALLCALLIALASIAGSRLAGDAWGEAWRSSSLLVARKLASPINMDSWAPMWSGLYRVRDGAAVPHERTPYERSWALDKCKFQYPPSALLLLEALPEPAALPMVCTPEAAATPAWTGAWPAKPWLSWASRLAVLATAIVAVLLLQRTLPAPGLGVRGALAAGAAALCFYPLVWAHGLGQVQVFMNLALALALLVVASRPLAAGVLVGLCCLLKPPCLLFVVWGGLRRERAFCIGLLASFGLGTGLAIAHYGLDLHVQYLSFLRGLSQTGEVYWANQTLNGVLNRLLDTGEAAVWIPGGVPALHPVVRWGTLLGALPVLGIALWSQRQDRDRIELDFATMLAALTIASPVGWEHHYGCFVAIFALLLGLTARAAAPPRAAWIVLGVAFVSVANVWIAPQHIFTGPLRGLLGSHLWYGALLTLGLLVYWRDRGRVVQRGAWHAACIKWPTMRWG